MEGPERTVVIGRSADADVVIADPTVAPRHAELVVTSNGRLHLTDCATSSGTWRRGPGQDEWVAIRQEFVPGDSEVRFGDHRCRVADLVATSGPVAPAATEPGPGAGRHAPGRRGRIERDPATGEIVRRRF